MCTFISKLNKVDLLISTMLEYTTLIYMSYPLVEALENDPFPFSGQ